MYLPVFVIVSTSSNEILSPLLLFTLADLNISHMDRSRPRAFEYHDYLIWNWFRLLSHNLNAFQKASDSNVFESVMAHVLPSSSFYSNNESKSSEQDAPRRAVSVVIGVTYNADLKLSNILILLLQVKPSDDVTESKLGIAITSMFNHPHQTACFLRCNNNDNQMNKVCWTGFSSPENLLTWLGLCMACDVAHDY